MRIPQKGMVKVLLQSLDPSVAWLLTFYHVAGKPPCDWGGGEVKQKRAPLLT